MSNPVKVSKSFSLTGDWDTARSRVISALEVHAQAINLKLEHHGLSTGAKTATFSATNKPGTNNKTSPDKWLEINVDGTAYYVPCYLA